jgi:hypothetical protein
MIVRDANIKMRQAEGPKRRNRYEQENKEND